ncbi:flagellar basal-body MS-ring/collar protein FliF [Cohnella faecalis]|uniref:Flagellar M-ring protein n=1 Tax=Cohnella faecalis TaxID=2315694 RepID=A0A398CKP4_9BACL|nr:flagellar basal-body MS-ring/collar protein FliF [Cohnella faecalis]RIE03283.1 flagellar M-ring protein FliF [Cohnella faecalis]
MNEKLGQVRERLSGFWNQYSKKQKAVLGGAALLLLLTIILLTYAFTRTEYELAFQNLDNTDAQSIIQYLDAEGISYKLGADGSSISVPSAAASRVKVAVGSQGLVQQGSIGFAEMTKGSSAIGTTDNEFKVKYRNALNGEIQQLLLGMQGVQRAKVLVNLPEESVFLSDQDREKATASVVMTFKPGFRPKQEEIDSYFNLVKTAVPNLDVDGITITSTSGELTPSNGGSNANSSGIVETQFEIRRKFENDIKRNIQSFLNPIVGMDNMVVSVVSTLNFDKQVTEVNKVEPLPNNDNKGIVISEKTSNESYTGQSGQTGGVAGTGETDISNYPGGTTSEGTSSEKTSTTTNYEPTRIKDQIEYAPYKVKDLAVNVAVAESVMTPEKQNAYKAMLVANVRTLLAESGLELTDEALASRVSVISQSFEGNGSVSSGVAASTYWLAGLGVLALALLGGGGYIMYRRRKASEEAKELAEMAATRTELPTIDIDNVAGESQVRKQLESLAKRKPEEFVNLLRTWLVDE